MSAVLFREGSTSHSAFRDPGRMSCKALKCGLIMEHDMERGGGGGGVNRNHTDGEGEKYSGICGRLNVWPQMAVTVKCTFLTIWSNINPRFLL